MADVYNEINDSISKGKVETYRDIITPIIEQTNSEGSSSSSSSSAFGTLLCIILTGLEAGVCTVYLGVKPVITIILCIVTFIVLFELIPFRLLKRLKDFRRRATSIESTFKQLNKIRNINEDGSISVNGVTGILLECTTNFYLNLSNYATDFDRYIEIFHRFNISITGMIKIKGQDYVSLDNVGVYSDKIVKYERIKLARQVKKELELKSKIYNIYIFISGPDHEIDNIWRTYRESLSSTYKRVFSKIELVTGDKLYYVLSRELLIPINRNNIYSDRSKTEKKVINNTINIKEI